MNSLLRRVGATLSPAALLVAILALVFSAAGVGFAAGQIGTSGIKNNVDHREEDQEERGHHQEDQEERGHRPTRSRTAP